MHNTAREKITREANSDYLLFLVKWEQEHNLLTTYEKFQIVLGSLMGDLKHALISERRLVGDADDPGKGQSMEYETRQRAAENERLIKWLADNQDLWQGVSGSPVDIVLLVLNKLREREARKEIERLTGSQAPHWNDREKAVIAELSDSQALTAHQVLRQALRNYQVHVERLRAGETCVWSGDAQRAAEFARFQDVQRHRRTAEDDE